mmetsp:Transcript_4321/g.8960  ORF Transcript_4321/g.8960 Transcript_4321/m.8960 type:complete len:332 (+) Transcript_4321:491-1486(+)
MYSAIRLKDEEPRVLHKLIRRVAQKVVTLQYELALVELLLRTLEVKVHVQALQELGERVRVGVLLLLDHTHQALELVPPPLVNDNGSSEVAQQPRGVGLNGLDVALSEKGVDDEVLALRVVEKHEERPVEKPRALLELLLVRGVAVLDRFLQRVHLGHSLVPVFQQNLRAELAPLGVEAKGGRDRLGLLHTQVVRKHSVRRLVVTAVVFEFSITVVVVESLRGHIVVRRQVLEVKRALLLESTDRVLVCKERLQRFVLALKPPHFLVNLVTLRGHVRRGVLGTRNVLVDLDRVVDHVGRLQEREPRLLHLDAVVLEELVHLHELEQGKHEV